MLASGVAHEINNPVQSIMNYAQLIRSRSDSPQLKTYAEEILHESQRVASIIRNLLSFARQGSAPRTQANVAHVVEASVALVAAVLRKEQVAIAVDLPDDLPSIECNVQQIQQALMNLLTSARDALNDRYPGGHEEKKVTLSGGTVSVNGVTFVRITLLDHGTDIPDEAMDRLFEPFSSVVGRDQGTGLGLSTSHGIIQDHGGRLSVESGGGSTRFHMDLPVELAS